MQQYVVYGDVLWLINFCLDFILLWATAKAGRFPLKKPRLILAAVVGAFYGVCILVPQFSFAYLFPIKIGFSLLMIWLAFGALPLRSFCKAVLYFYLLSFTMAGAVLGGSSLLKSNGIDYFNGYSIHWLSLLFAAFAAVFLVRWAISYIRRNFRKESLIRKAVISIGSQKIQVNTFMDTGNELKDPVTQKPVMVVEYAALQNIFPKAFSRLYEKYAAVDVVKIVEKANVMNMGFNLRLIPFNAIGRDNGILLGIKPKRVVFKGNKGIEDIMMRDIIICLYHRPLGKSKGYNAIINPMVLEEASQIIKGERIWGYGA
ncbi:MAG: sigma-E processing peptidase SpoIIGA [Clostridia bacterium]|nr:sigma-E processing peptidase SpoIIGA [Clostridia bacterium]